MVEVIEVAHGSYCVALGQMDVQDLGFMDHGPMVHLDDLKPWSEVTRTAEQCDVSTACALCHTRASAHVSLSRLSTRK